MADLPPLLLFLSRELADSKVFSSSKGISMRNWANAMATQLPSPRPLDETIQVASALPLPLSPKHQQTALEHVVCMFPSRPLWRLRSHPQSQVDDPQHAYWARQESLYQAVLGLPAINPLSPIQSRELAQKTGSGKLPLAVVAMCMGRPELLDLCVDSLPAHFVMDAVHACAEFGQVDLAQRCIQRLDPADATTRQAAHDAIWDVLSLRHVANAEPLPQSDPPSRWWDRIVNLLHEKSAAADRLLAARPHLAPELTNAFLRSREPDRLLQLQLRGGLDARTQWTSTEGWQGPALALVVSTWAQDAASDSNGTRLPHKLTQLRHALGLLRRLLPPHLAAMPVQQDWGDVAGYLLTMSPENDPVSRKGSWDPVASEGLSPLKHMQQILARWEDVVLTGKEGAPALAPAKAFALATVAAARQTYPTNTDAVVEGYVRSFLPLVRKLGIQATQDPITRDKAEAWNEAAKTLLVLPCSTEAPPTSMDDDLALEALLWRAMFMRLEARAKNGPGRVFPSMGVVIPVWSAAEALIKSGARPAWSQEDAVRMHSLLMADQKMPVSIRLLLEAEALRSGVPLARTKPRRI